MRVMIAYNEPVLPLGHPEADSERDILEVVDAIALQLERRGVELWRTGVGRDLGAFRRMLHRGRPEVVLNLFEGFGDDPESECRFAHVLEEQGVAFTGSSSETLWRGGRKDIAKQMFEQAGLTTPAWAVVERLPVAELQLSWPVIVKPAFRDASVGIHQSSVVTHRNQLEKQIADTAERYGLPVLVEEFIDGREISAAVIDAPELVVLPFVETVFLSNNGNRPIDSYDAKWQRESRDYRSRRFHYPAELAPDVAGRIAAMAREAYRALECRGFVTMDFRVRGDTPYLLELNPNADLKPTDCLTELFDLAGIEYGEYLWQMVLAASSPIAVKSG